MGREGDAQSYDDVEDESKSEEEAQEGLLSDDEFDPIVGLS